MKIQGHIVQTHLLVGDARVRVDDVLLLLVQDRDRLAQVEELLVQVVKLHLQDENEKES